MVWDPKVKTGFESMKIRYEIVEWVRGKGLDLGCGQLRAFKHMIGVDYHPLALAGANGAQINADITKLDVFADGGMDFVFSSHVLEHIEDPLPALKEWWKKVKEGGYLILYLPDSKLYPKRGTPDANEDHKHDFRPKDIIDYMLQAEGGWDLRVSERRDQGAEYSFLQVYQKTAGARHTYSYQKPRWPEKTVCVVRYGGIGDMLQTSVVCAAFKRLGWHVVLNTTPQGKDIVAHDPNIDEFLLQDGNCIPGHELTDYWKVLSKKFKRFANLSESVETSLLAEPDRLEARWPKKLRHERMDRNYLEFMHELVEVPFAVPEQLFYPTDEERAWAEGLKSFPTIFIALSGSSVHKGWPFMDMLMARILQELPDVRIVLTGDKLSQMLSHSWRSEPRVLDTCGEWTVRQSLVFATCAADLVLGPETGILNAVGYANYPAKLLFLSHSSFFNLSRDWKNCVSFSPNERDCPCHPCHMLHREGFSSCTRDEETGGSLCQAKIPLEALWQEVKKWHKGLRDREAANG